MVFTNLHLDVLLLFSLLFFLSISPVSGVAYPPSTQVPIRSSGGPSSHKKFDPYHRDPLVDEYASGETGTYWDYTSSYGPLLWTRLNKKEWPLCSTGDLQSPINIGPGMKPSGFKYEWSGPKDACYNMTNNGNTIELIPVCGRTASFDDDEFEDGNAYFDREEGDSRMGVMYDDDWFNLQNIHFHTPSEHRYLEEYFPLEAHFVMKSSKTGRFAIRAIFFDVTSGEESNLWDGITKNLEKVQHSGQWTKVRINTIDIMKIFQDHGINNRVYNYHGSLTTPPCTQNVIWDVLSVPQKASTRTYNLFKRIIRFNSRYTQNVPGRGNLLVEACGKR
ncbi:alpha carbonic anhydrase [Peziza echinospora]|nr:alpha carbonic anhydrase [Peziza echinospora]